MKYILDILVYFVLSKSVALFVDSMNETQVGHRTFADQVPRTQPLALTHQRSWQFSMANQWAVNFGKRTRGTGP